MLEKCQIPDEEKICKLTYLWAQKTRFPMRNGKTNKKYSHNTSMSVERLQKDQLEHPD